MSTGVSVPVHLAVHLLGVAVTVGLAIFGVVRRRSLGPAWLGLVSGGALLALSHVAIGALLADQLVWPLYVRAAGYAALAVGAAGKLIGVAVVAVGPPVAHVAAAVAGAMAAVAAARGVVGRGREVLPLVVGLVAWSLADLATRQSVPLASALSILGSLAAGAWLLRRARRSLLARFAVSSVTVLLLLALGLAAASGVVFSSDLEGDQLDRLDELAEGTAAQTAEDWPGELVRAAAPLAGPRLASEILQATDETKDDLNERAATITELPGVDVAVIVSTEGRVIGSWDATASEPGPLPPAEEATIAGDMVVERSLTGLDTRGLIPLGTGQLLAAGAAPAAPAGRDGQPRLDQQAGSLVLGREIAAPNVVEQVRRRTGAEAAVVVGGQVSASSLDDSVSEELARLVGLSDDSRVVTLGDQERFLAMASLEAEDGTQVGTVALVLDAGALADIEESFTRRLFLFSLIGLGLAAILAAALATRTTRPILRLTEAAEHVAAGDLDVRAGVSTEDEVGRLGTTFDDMTHALQAREDDLRQAAATEAALRTRLEIVTASMSEALLATDRDGVVTTANPAAAALLGRDRKDIVGRPLSKVLGGTDAVGASLVQALRSEGDVPAATRGAVERDGRKIPVAASSAPLTEEDGQERGRVYVLRDVTGEVEVERMKTEFLSNISHELRTPLTPIRGYGEVLRERDVGYERTAEFATNIVEAAGRLERVIGMLVDFASLEAGRMSVRLEAVNLEEVVDETLETWRNRRPDRRFTRYLRKDLPPVQVDPDLLRRTLEEVIDNAVKFSDGPVRILAHQDGDRVRVTVRDEGEGIPEEQLEAILSDFNQADGSATREIGGLGLGLAIVRRILDRFEGDLEIDSTLGEGTDVHLLLPVAA